MAPKVQKKAQVPFLFLLDVFSGAAGGNVLANLSNN